MTPRENLPAPSSHSGLAGRPKLQFALRLGALAAAYFLAHRIAFLFPDAERVLMAVWPAGGIGLAVLLLRPRREWLAILSVLFAAGNLANLTSGRQPLASLGFMTANVLESLACAWMILRWCGPRVRFERVRDIMALLAAATLANASTAFIGAATAVLVVHAAFWDFYWTWWTADGLGILLVTPLLVCSAAKARLPAGFRWRRGLEAAALAAATCAVAWMAFGPADTCGGVVVRPYVLLGFVAWAALRFGLCGTAALLAAAAAISIHLTATGHSLFSLGGHDATHRLLMVQIFLGVASTVGMLLAASHAEQRTAAENLRRSQAFLDQILENSPAPMWVSDAHGTLLRVNPALCKTLRVSREELVGKYNMLQDSVVEEQGFMPQIRAVFDQGQPARFVIRYDTAGVEGLALKEKTTAILDVNIAPVFDDAGRVTNAIVQHIDITAREQMKQAAAAALEEKTVLLQEIHHRVKNNLQIVVSLLNLKAARIDNPEARAAFRDTQDRVRSMALLHETLYRTGNLARIHLPDYVTTLTANLIQSAGPGPGRIRLECRVDDVALALDQAVPCGLIINELVTNALKHAFPNERPGLIQVEVREAADHQVVLSVADNGAGLPAESEPSTRSTLGLRLVHMLAQQLQGSVQMTRQNGAAFQITFPITATDALPEASEPLSR